MKLSILTPEKQLFDGEVTSVKVPGSRGPFEILNNHAPVVSSLAKGEVLIKTSNGEETFNIENGFVEVLNNNISLLVQSAVEK